MSTIVEQTRPDATPIPGVSHSTWASGADGLSQISVWRQSLAPASATPPHQHDCDEVVLCLGGWGELHCDGRVQRFGAETTVILPKNRVHQLFNVGPMPLELIGIFGATPVATRLPNGEAIALPWAS
jgi:mannose-6-phosphate isomerase-like protein (cupin superfamily)